MSFLTDEVLLLKGLGVFVRILITTLSVSLVFFVINGKRDIIPFTIAALITAIFAFFLVILFKIEALYIAFIPILYGISHLIYYRSGWNIFAINFGVGFLVLFSIIYFIFNPLSNFGLSFSTNCPTYGCGEGYLEDREATIFEIFLLSCTFLLYARMFLIIREFIKSLKEKGNPQ